MERLFGIPLSAFATIVAVALAGSLVVLAALAVRDRVLLKIALRSVRRRRGRSALIVVGLMLATAIITSALATGDTMATSIRSSVLDSLGHTDEMVSVESAHTATLPGVAAATGEAQIDESVVPSVIAAAERIPLVDGVTPAVIEPVAVRDETSRQNEPRVTLFGSDPARQRGFGTITGVDGRAVSLASLATGEAYLNADGAHELHAKAGDRVVVLAGTSTATFVVRAVVRYRGAGTDGPALLVPLAVAQSVLGRPGLVDHVLVSNRGGTLSGVRHTDAVVDALTPAVRPLGLEVQPSKRDGLDTADEQGNAFMTLFTTFGSFSIVAGILLVFLIFVMLAAERRGELGVARAIGTQRRHLVQLFVYEGAAYDLLAAAAGVAVGTAIAFAMVTIVGSALGSSFEVTRRIEARSLLVAYGLGVLLTLVVVTLSAWRVSVLNIVTAVRNLPEPIVRRAGGRRWTTAVVVGLAGAGLTAAGAAGADALSFNLGVSVLVLAGVLVARAAHAPARAIYTVAGIVLVVWWLLPSEVVEWMIGKPKMNFSIFVVGGLMVVLGATWTVMYNADAILGAIVALLGRIRSLTPVLRMAVAYPLRSRFRTGVTLAMFTLVVFTLVVGSATSNSFIRHADDLQRFGGGFDVRADTAAVSPVDDMRAAISAAPGLRAPDFTVVAGESFVPVDARQTDTTRPMEAYAARGLDSSFLEHTTYRLGARARGYASDRAVWDALRSTPGLAVVDATVVPRRQNWMFGAMPDFRLSGFFVEDGVFDPVPVEVRYPATGQTLTLTVVGVLSDDAPYSLAGISTSADTLAPLGAAARPSTWYFRLAPGVDAGATATALERTFLENGMQAETMRKVLDDAVGASLTFQRLILGFMGLGLVVGVAALGVVSARSVVERRQQIGVLRAVGFQRGMVRLTFLLEASFVALSAIVLGSVLGLVVGFNVVRGSRATPSYHDLRYAVPWTSLGLVFALVYLAALAATIAPAVRASRVYPARALRYE